MTHPNGLVHPYEVYPGFREPEDWREAEPDVKGTVHQHQLVELVVSDAANGHIAKHGKHDHPWCRYCLIRFDNVVRLDSSSAGAGTSAPVLAPGESYNQLNQELSGQAEQAGGQPFTGDIRGIVTAWTAADGWSLEQIEEYAHGHGVPVAGVEAVAAHAANLKRWEEANVTAGATVRRRAARYIILNGRPPADNFDPESAENDFDAEYLDADELEDLPVPEPLIEGVLMRHSYAILRGRDGTLKSFTALDWALCLATGKRWQARDVEQVRVLYIAGEGAYGLAARMKAWEYAWRTPIDPEFFTVRKSAVNLYKGGPALTDLLTRMPDYQFGLVVIDTLRRASGGADGNSSDMGTVVDNIERIKNATANGSVLVIAHTDKGDNDSRGYSGIEDDADIVWSAKREEGVLTLKNTKMKDGPDGLEIVLKAIPTLDSLVLGNHRPEAPGTDDLTASEERVMDAMRTTFALTGATANELIDTTGLARSTFYRVRGQLLKSGQLVATGSRSRQRLEMPQSHSVQVTETPEIQTSLTQSNSVPPQSHSVPSRPTPLKGWDGDSGTGQDQNRERETQ